MMRVVNVLDKYNRGWLAGTIKHVGITNVPFTTKVSLVSQSDDSEVVMVEEGHYRGAEMTIPYVTKDGKYSFISELPISKKSLDLILCLKESVLFCDNKKYAVRIDNRSFNIGNYLIKLPMKTSKNLPISYFNEKKGGSRFVDSWFPIISSEKKFTEQFLHFGSYSEGCITLIKHLDNNIWEDIYMFLIKNRIGLGELANLYVR